MRLPTPVIAAPTMTYHYYPASVEHQGSLSELWSDGSIERGHIIIRQNRDALFARREYRQSRHSLVLNRIRCLTSDIAVADGKWDLRGVMDNTGKPLATMEGLVYDASEAARDLNAI